MVKKKKSKGASLVIVVIITSIILSLGIAMLSMSLMGYKARVSESRRLQNLYESDSGLDIVYNIIRKTSAVAIQKSCKDVIDIPDEDIRNTQFKVNFLNYLVTDSGDTVKLESYIRDWKYPEYKVVGKSSIIENKDIDVSIHPKVIGTDTDSVIVDSSHQTDESRLTVTAKTTFSSPTGQFTNTKTIEAQFVIDAPNYNDVIRNTGVDIQVNPAYEGKIITADGDLIASGNVSVDGDIWIKGDTSGPVPDPYKYSYDKYIGGITLKDGTFDFIDNDTTKDTNEIYTPKTLNIQKAANTTVAGNIYSSNTYLGNTEKGDPNNDAKLYIDKGEVVTNNDLALNSDGGIANIYNYYGINDKNIEKTADLAARNSSCIIVNNKSSSLYIENEAYILGLAYIDTKEEKYQTGESVAVKGNYVAYTDPGTDNNVTLKYYEPLQLIDKMDGDALTAAKKTDHFISYYSNHDTLNTSGGIMLPKKESIFSTGAVVSTNNDNPVDKGMKKFNDIKTNLFSKRDNYAKNVLAMGDVVGLGSGKTESSVYDEGFVVRSVAGGTNVLPQINFNAIDNTTTLDEDDGKVILNKEPGVIMVEKGKVSILNNARKSNLRDFTSDDMKGIIVTSGDVIIRPGVKFTGNIIAGGKVTIQGNATNLVELIYNEDVTRKIHARNKDYLDDVFINDTEGYHHIILEDKQGGDISDYYEKDFIKKGTWKVVK